MKNCVKELWEQLKSIEWNDIFQVITSTDKAIFSKAKVSILQKWDLGCVSHADRERHWESNPKVLMRFTLSNLNEYLSAISFLN